MQTASPVYVSRIAAVTALGAGLEDTWSRLCAGESAIRTLKRFTTSRLMCNQAAWVDYTSLPAAENNVCRLVSAAVDQIGSVPEHASVIWTGIKGSAEMVESEDHTGPHRPEQYREWICRRLGLSMRGFEVNAACVAFTAGIALAAQLIRNRMESAVLVCGADIVSRFVFTGFSALRALAPGACRPFDKNRDGLAIGEGAAAMLLCGETSGLPVIAEVAGWGSANDANHITGPSRDGHGLMLSITHALRRAKMTPDEIEAICCHGTGTVYNDAMELAAVSRVFGNRKFPLFSVKGALGHTLGAAGGIESAVSIRALHERMIPPTVGLNDPDEGALGRAVGISQIFGGNTILKTSSGFGGCNSAVIFKNV